MSVSSSSSIIAASSLRLVTRSVSAPESDEDVRRNPPLNRCHQLTFLLPLSFIFSLSLSLLFALSLSLLQPP